MDSKDLFNMILGANMFSQDDLGKVSEAVNKSHKTVNAFEALGFAEKVVMEAEEMDESILKELDMIVLDEAKKASKKKKFKLDPDKEFKSEVRRLAKEALEGLKDDATRAEVMAEIKLLTEFGLEDHPNAGKLKAAAFRKAMKMLKKKNEKDVEDEKDPDDEAAEEEEKELRKDEGKLPTKVEDTEEAKKALLEKNPKNQNAWKVSDGSHSDVYYVATAEEAKEDFCDDYCKDMTKLEQFKRGLKVQDVSEGKLPDPNASEADKMKDLKEEETVGTEMKQKIVARFSDKDVAERAAKDPKYAGKATAIAVKDPSGKEFYEIRLKESEEVVEAKKDMAKYILAELITSDIITPDVIANYFPNEKQAKAFLDEIVPGYSEDLSNDEDGLDEKKLKVDEAKLKKVDEAFSPKKLKEGKDPLSADIAALDATVRNLKNYFAAEDMDQAIEYATLVTKQAQDVVGNIQMMKKAKEASKAVTEQPAPAATPEAAPVAPAAKEEAIPADLPEAKIKESFTMKDVTKLEESVDPEVAKISKQYRFGSIQWQDAMILLARKRIMAGEPIGPELVAFIEVQKEHESNIEKEKTKEVSDIQKSFDADNSQVPNESKKVDNTKELKESLKEQKINEGDTYDAKQDELMRIGLEVGFNEEKAKRFAGFMGEAFKGEYFDGRYAHEWAQRVIKGAGPYADEIRFPLLAKYKLGEGKLPVKPEDVKDNPTALLEEKEITELAEKAILCAFLKTKKSLTEKEQKFVAEVEKVQLDECKRGKVDDMVKKMKSKKSKKAKKEEKK